MDILIKIENQQALSVIEGVEEKFQLISEKVLTYEGIITTTEISVTYVDNQAIQVLNALHRQKDMATDVLSFPQYENLKDEDEIDEELNLGDVVISIEKAIEQAGDFGHSLERELCYLYTHSLLHLIGYDHDTEEQKNEMRKIEEWVLSELGILRA